MKANKRVRRDYTRSSLYKVNISESVASERAKKAWVTKRLNGTDKVWNKGKVGLQNAWNKGLTAKTDNRVKKYTISMTQTVQQQFKNKERKVNGYRHWKDTDIERILHKELDKLSIKYYKNYPINFKNFTTFPDIYIPASKLCIYADGEYWHNYPFGSKKDNLITRKLRRNKYKVLRFWGRQLKRELPSCIRKIKEKI